MLSFSALTSLAVIGMTRLAALAAESPTPEVRSPVPLESPRAIDPSKVTPGLLGFLSFLFLVVAGILLYLSLRNQLRKVDFVEEPVESPAEGKQSDGPSAQGDPGNKS